MPTVTVQDTLADAVLASMEEMARYLAGFDDASATRQAQHLPNHVVWTLGHLALTMARAQEKLDGAPVPASCFVSGARGDAQRFGVEGVSFGSVPTADASAYPAFPRARGIFDEMGRRLAACVRGLGDGRLDEVVPWGWASPTVRQLATRQAMHVWMHVGQIADLRRALRMPSVFA